LEERSNLRDLEVSIKGVAKKRIARVIVGAWLNGEFATRRSCIEYKVQEKQQESTLQNGMLICHVVAMAFTLLTPEQSLCVKN